MCAAEATGQGPRATAGRTGRSVVSVIGPDREAATAVATALGHRLPGRTFVVGAGPAEATGVIAVTGAGAAGPSGRSGPPDPPGQTGAPPAVRDATVVRAVRDSTGGCVLYTGSGGTDGAAGPPDLTADEPGVTVVRWTGDDPTSPGNLDGLVDAVRSLWVDVPRWLSDVRRADADRIDRVRVAVRLAAERDAADLLDPGTVDVTDPAGRRHLTNLFRARLRCTVLEQGVEWPHVPGPDGPDATHAADATDGAGAGRDDGDRQRVLLLVVASLGAGLAVALGAGRLAGPVVGALAGLVVAGALGLVRWRTLATARRARDRARWTARLRREWSAVATEVVARLRVPTVADALLDELRQEPGPGRRQGQGAVR